MDTKHFYNEILTDHNMFPDNKRELPEADIELEGVNPSCGDDIVLRLKLDGDIISDAAFTGSGCAVSQASADIMAGLVVGLTKEKALHLSELFFKMIRGSISDEELEELDEAGALQDIAHMPARAKCALLGWRTLNEAFGVKL